MTPLHPIFQKELDAFEKKFPYRTRDTAEFQEKRKMLDFLLASLQRASMAVVEESVGWEMVKQHTGNAMKDAFFNEKVEGANLKRNNTLATAREITGTNKQ